MNADSTPAERLLLSRERLRVALLTLSDDSARAAAAQPAWLAALQALPGAQVLTAALRRWWQQHPLHLAGSLAASTAHALAKPVAEKHPLALMAAALALGAVFAWSRPWRWLPRPALLAGLWPLLLREALKRPSP